MFYIRNESTDPHYNQALEEVLFCNFTNGDLFMIWQNRPCAVCGKFQNPYEELNLRFFSENDAAIIRRNTGGGTVYHDEGNYNYSIITDYQGDGAEYDRFLLPMIQILQNLGIQAELGGKSEIQIGGKKISGSAQTVSRGRILHHGTLLFDSNLRKLMEMTNRDSQRYLSKAVKSNKAIVTNIAEHIDGMTRKEFPLAIEKQWKELQPITIPEEWRLAAEKLADEKYRTFYWTFGKTPPFSFCGEHPSGWKIEYRAVHGVITEFTAYFCGEYRQELALLLVGRPLIYDELLSWASAYFQDEITARNLLDCMF